MKKLYLVILVILGVVIMALPGAAQIGSVPCEEGGKTRIELPDDSVSVQETETSVSNPAAPAGQDGRDGKDGQDGRDGQPGQNGHDGQTIIKVIYVGGRQIGLNRHGKVVSTQRRQALRRDIHKEYRRSGVVSQSFVTARDGVVLNTANAYTDQQVGAASKQIATISARVWIAIVLSILALIVAAFAWRRRPAWRPVHY